MELYDIDDLIHTTRGILCPSSEDIKGKEIRKREGKFR